MPWLRLDDKFARHPKLIRLTRAQRWTWVEVLCYCAEFKTDGLVHPRTEIAGLTKATRVKFRAVGLLDVKNGEDWVHDWETYNPKDPGAAARMKRWRDTNPRVKQSRWDEVRREIFTRDAGVCQECGDITLQWHADHEPPRKQLELRGESIYDPQFIVTLCPSCHARKTRRQAAEARQTETEPPTEPETEPEANPDQTETAPRARAGARVPSRPVLSSSKGRTVVSSEPNGLPFEKNLLVLRLMAWIGNDADAQTKAVISKAAEDLPPSSLAKVLESALTKRPQQRARYAVGALRSERSEAQA